eukprot:3932937-Rhodomonas_salina.2
MESRAWSEVSTTTTSDMKSGPSFRQITFNTCSTRPSSASSLRDQRELLVGSEHDLVHPDDGLGSGLGFRVWDSRLKAVKSGLRVNFQT